MTTTSRPIVSCQNCDAPDLDPVLFLGYVPPVNAMPPIGAPPVEHPAYPLGLVRCRACGLAQNSTDVDQSVLFPDTYPYRSGSTRLLRDNFADLCREATALLDLRPDDLVLDIGSNDGTLLSGFLAKGSPVLGVEPSGAGADARARGIDTLTAFFGLDTARRIRADHGRAALVTACNVFAHMTDLHAVLTGITEVCAEDGVFVNESHYLPDLLTTLQYDTIYHEHLRYYDLHALRSILDKHGLEVFHARRIPTHGGSIRVYAAGAGRREVLPSVARLLAEERRLGIVDGSAFTTFRDRVLRSKLDLLTLLCEVKREGDRIYGVGAPSRATTIVHYTGIDDGILDCVVEIASSPKVGRYLPGTVIPVVDERKLIEDQPGYALLLSWHIADELIDVLRGRGFRGRFIIPLPEPRVVG